MIDLANANREAMSFSEVYFVICDDFSRFRNTRPEIS
jgi:hypothetical protein